MAPSDNFICRVCGQTHSGLSSDWGYTLPDEVWALSAEERTARSHSDSDLCKLDNRYFIRGVLGIPFQENPGRYGWGIWVEVDAAVFRRCLDLWQEDGTAEPRYAAVIANAIPGYENTLGLLADIQFENEKTRLSIHMRDDSSSNLALEQRNGMTGQRYHELLTLTSARPQR